VLQLGFNDIHSLTACRHLPLGALKVLFLQGNDISRLEGLDVLSQVRVVEVCCSVLQRVAVCRSVLQCVASCQGNDISRLEGLDALLQGCTVAACCSVLQYVAACCSVLHRVRVMTLAASKALMLPRRCALLQCVAVWYNMLKCVAVCFSVVKCVAA